MNDLTVTQPFPTRMTSREIAELTGKQHKHVIRDVKSMASGLYQIDADGPDLDHVDSKGIFVDRDARGYVATISLDKDHTLTLLTGYDVQARHRVVKRWQELEAQHAQPAVLPQDYLSALKELVTTLEEKKALEQDNALLNTIIDNEFGYSSILRAAQYLGVNEKTFNWRPLKRWTLESGLEVKRVPSPRFPYQNLYPIAAFEHCYPQFDFSGLQPEAVANRATKLLTGHVASAFH